MPSDIIIHQTNFGKPNVLANALVIEIFDNVIKFCELQADQNKPLSINNYPIDQFSQITINEHLINAIKHFQFLKKTYEHVYVNYFTQQFTLCPANFYNTENARSLLEFNTGSTNEKPILTDDVNADIKLIYSIDESLKSTLDQIFPHHQVKHTLTVSSKLMLQSEELVKEHILLSVNSNYIEVVVKQDQKLLLANQFSTKTEEDILYYVLFILEQYQLNPLTANISLSGNIDSTSSLVISLKKYIKNIRLVLGHKTIIWDELTGMPQHFNYTLLNRLFCE